MGLARTANRKPPQGKQNVRRDPHRRPVEQSFGPRVINGLPGYKYKLIHKGQIEEYEFTGHVIVMKGDGPDAPRLSVGKTCQAGEPITYRDMTLMSLTPERALEIETYGEDGGSGQARVDEIEDQIVDRRPGQNDPLRGMHSSKRRGLSVVSEITDASVEDVQE